MTFLASTDVSPSGVQIARDFRDNLIIDRYDPVFADMRASKIKHLRSANSEDAVTWNVFRSLRQIAPTQWLPSLWSQAFPDIEHPDDLAATVTLWPSVPPPLGLLAFGDEGASEIDIRIETPTWVWFIEAKFRSDISTGTTTRPDRDQVLRNIDVGSYYAGVRRFYFSLLVISDTRSPEGMKRVREYSDFSEVRSALHGHRPDGVANLSGVGTLTWSDLASTLLVARENAPRPDEERFANHALEWLETKGIHPKRSDSASFSEGLEPAPRRLTAEEAVLAAVRGLSGEVGIEDVKRWIATHSLGTWKDIGTTMADLSYHPSPTSGYPSERRFLERVGDGRYRLRSDWTPQDQSEPRKLTHAPSAPPAPVTWDALYGEAERLHGTTLETLYRAKHFTVRVLPEAIEFTPLSTGEPRVNRRAVAERMLERFNQDASFEAARYHDITVNSSYLLVLIKRVLAMTVSEESRAAGVIHTEASSTDVDVARGDP